MGITPSRARLAPPYDRNTLFLPCVMFRFFVCGVAFFFCVVLCCCCVVLCFSFCVAFLFVGWCILQILRTEYVQFWRARESSEPECAFGVSNLPSRGGQPPAAPPRAPLLPPKGPGTSPGSPRPPGKTLTCLLINYFRFGRVFSHFWPNGRTHRVGLSSDGQEQVSSNVCPPGFWVRFGLRLHLRLHLLLRLQLRLRLRLRPRLRPRLRWRLRLRIRVVF